MVLPAVSSWRLGALLTCLVVAVSALQVPAAHATQDPVVRGRFLAHSSSGVALCVMDCLQPGHPMPLGLWDDPGYYEMEVRSRTGRFSSPTGVAPGTYRLYYNGYPYTNEGGYGYLRLREDGFYEHTDSFEEAVVVTVEEGEEDVDLGVFDTQYAGPASATVNSTGPTRAKGYGGEMREASVRMVAKELPQGSRVVIKSYGCGERQTVTRYAVEGSTKFTWRDKRAYRHYGKSIRLVATIKFADGRKRVAYRTTRSVKSFGWSC
ncbi:hypothetical protein BKA08_000447 [Nocardioides marinisabuli]|uniref:Carboxypeptidase regulatory-like domain-containing protein n=1 Tax=Nocardioides marinisabuli TaxID=419476 RepID=A0A7Y9EYH0_9ACTN|nr:hypothetical protein [Nocardioides marinisabuli]NYD56209.1 hypothetical protein [Nocardioides marinisabuli]